MPRPSVRSLFIAFWKYVSAEAFLLIVSAVLALATASYFAPSLETVVSLRTPTLVISSILKEEAIDWEALADPLIFLALLTVSIRVLISVVPRIALWFISLQNRSDIAVETIPSGPLNTQTSAFSLRRRANRLRGTGQMLLGTIGVIVLLGFVMFQSAEKSVMGMYYGFALPLETQSMNLTNEVNRLVSQNRPEAVNLLNEKREQLKKIEAKLAEMTPSRSLPMYLLFILSTKVAAVVFLVFLVQLLSNIYRYLTRLAFFLDSRADILELLGTTPNTETLIDMLVPEKAVDMDHTPAFPVLEQLKDVLKTLGGKG